MRCGVVRGAPVGEVEAVVDGLDAGGIDSIDLDAMLADQIRDGEDGIGKAGHEAIGEVVLACPEDAHVATAPNEVRICYCFCY